MNLKQFEALALAARPTSELDYGSQRQEDAFNAFFAAAEDVIPGKQFAAFEEYCLKATTEEAIDEALRLVRANI